jgi:hypothetical protein
MVSSTALACVGQNAKQAIEINDLAIQRAVVIGLEKILEIPDLAHAGHVPVLISNSRHRIHRPKPAFEDIKLSHPSDPQEFDLVNISRANPTGQRQVE